MASQPYAIYAALDYATYQVYVGLSRQIQVRLWRHRRGSGCPGLRKLPKAQYKVLSDGVPDLAEARRLEKVWLDCFVSTGWQPLNKQHRRAVLRKHAGTPLRTLPESPAPLERRMPGN